MVVESKRSLNSIRLEQPMPLDLRMVIAAGHLVDRISINPKADMSCVLVLFSIDTHKPGPLPSRLNWHFSFLLDDPLDKAMFDVYGRDFCWWSVQLFGDMVRLNIAWETDTESSS